MPTNKLLRTMENSEDTPSWKKTFSASKGCKYYFEEIVIAMTKPQFFVVLSSLGRLFVLTTKVDAKDKKTDGSGASVGGSRLCSKIEF